MERRKIGDFPPEVLKLFDGYIHGKLGRREFLDRAARYAVGGFTAAAMLESLTPNYALAQQVAKDDARIKTEYLTYPSPNGSGTMRGYFARPANACAIRTSRGPGSSTAISRELASAARCAITPSSRATCCAARTSTPFRSRRRGSPVVTGAARS